MDFKKAVKVAVAMKGITQTNLGESCGMSSSQMAHMLGRGTCSLMTLERLASALEMKVSEFIKLGE